MSRGWRHSSDFSEWNRCCTSEETCLEIQCFYQYLMMPSLNIESWSPSDVAQWIKSEEVQNFVAKYMFDLIYVVEI